MTPKKSNQKKSITVSPFDDRFGSPERAMAAETLYPMQAPRRWHGQPAIAERAGRTLQPDRPFRRSFLTSAIPQTY
jgi:hypothetical protein